MCWSNVDCRELREWCKEFFFFVQDGRRTLKTDFEKAEACSEQERNECLKGGYQRKECFRTRLYVGHCTTRLGELLTMS